MLRCFFGLALVLANATVAAQGVALSGTMGQRALLVIDGQPQMLAVGESARGVKLHSLQGDEARIERAGAVAILRVGGSQVSVGGRGSASGGSEVVMTAGPGGHFMASGAINGRAVRFMVDTGATTIAMGQADAERIGLDWRKGERGWAQTANGPTVIYGVTLSSVRLGDVEVANVSAAVMPAQMPFILLGNSFLTRFQMRRDNDVMRLELRR